MDKTRSKRSSVRSWFREKRYFLRSRLGFESTQDPPSKSGTSVIASADHELPRWQYDKECPYYQGKSRVQYPCKFRLREVFDNSESDPYVGDSFGDHFYIDASQARECSDQCFCRVQDSMSEGGDFVFTVSKTPKKMTLKIHSPALHEMVLSALSQCPEKTGYVSGDLDAFVLLKYYPLLESNLKRLRDNCIRHNARKQEAQLVAEMDLLTNGLLKDREVFYSFGYENLYRQGYLTYDRWQSFQHTKIDRDLNALENAFYDVDEARRSRPKNGSIPSIGSSLAAQSDSTVASSSLPSSSSSPSSSAALDLDLLRSWVSIPSPDIVSTSLSMAASQGDVKRVEELLNHGADPNSVHLPFYLRPALIEAIKGDHEDVARLLVGRGASVDGVTVDGFSTLTHRPLVTAFRRGNGAMFQALLRQGADPGSFVETPSEEQWLLAKCLVDSGVDANLLLRKAYDAGHPDKKLVSVLLDGGAALETVTKKSSATCPDDAIYETDKFADDLASFRSLNAQLIDASVAEDLESISRLVQSGAEPSWALPAALQNGCFLSLRYLLDAGANPKYLGCLDQQRSSPKAGKADMMLHNAVAIGHTPLTKLLLDHGASLDKVDISTRLVPLVTAIRGRRLAIAQLLLERGATVNQDPVGDGDEPLAEALAIRDSSMVSMLLRHGAQYEGMSKTEAAVPETFQTHLDLKKDLWDFACPLYHSSADSQQPSDLTLLGQKAIKTRISGDCEERQAKTSALRSARREELENVLGSPEATLIVAASQGNLIDVQSILEAAQDATIRKGAVAASLVNLDAVFREPANETVDDGLSVPRELTALMAASSQGDQRVVKLLLQHGADVNILTKSGTALSIAAEVGSDAIIRLLLRRQADLHVAVFVLRSTDPDSGAIRRLNTAASRLKKDLINSGLQAKLNLRRLYFEFLREHALMKTVGQTMNGPEAAWARKHYTDLEYLDLSRPAEFGYSMGQSGYRYRWAMGLERHGRKAWAVSISVLRGLCRGVLPTTLCETLTFLSLAKAVSATMDVYGLSDRQSKFVQDLSRWQILFSPEDGSLEAFKEAVHAIWGVTMEDDPSIQSPDKDSLLQFQVLASSLVRRVDDYLYLAELVNGGLLGSQRQWFSRRANGPSKHGARARSHSHSGDGAEEEAESDLANSQTGSADLGNGILEGRSCGPSVRRSMREECYFEDFQPLVVFLMAGAIFATLLLFLSEIRQTLNKTHGASPLEQTLYLEQRQRPVLKSALCHILLTCNSSFSPATLGNVKVQTIRAIGDGLLTSFAQMTRFFAEHPVFSERDVAQPEARNVRQQLISLCSIWSSTYGVQETYRALEIYLGLGGYVSVVPRLFRPRSYEEVIGEDESPSPASNLGLDRHNSSCPPRSTLEHVPSTRQVGDDCTPSSSTSAARSRQASPSSEVVLRRPRKTFCDECGRDFKKVFNYNKHRRDKHEGCRYACRSPRCEKSFSRHAYREIHEWKKHELRVR